MTRSMPAMNTIAAYWSRGFTSTDRAEEVFGSKFTARYIGWGEPFCFGCGWLAPVNDDQSCAKSWRSAGMWLDRAHIIPVMLGGDDECDNLIPLCSTCHRQIDKRILITGELQSKESIIKAIIDMPRCSSFVQWYWDHLYGTHQGNSEAALWDIESMKRQRSGESLQLVKDLCDPIADKIIETIFGHPVRTYDSRNRT
jgi:HNH endonuclease